MTQVTAFVPLMHVQVVPNPLCCNYNFSCGAKLVYDNFPTHILNALSKYNFDASYSAISRLEKSNLNAALGWLWFPKEIAMTGGYDFRDQIAMQLAKPLATLLVCIHLAGCGENTHWHFGPFENFWKLYIHSNDQYPDEPFGISQLHHFMSAQTPNDWSESRMTEADFLYRALTDYTGNSIPRLSTPFHSYLTLSSIRPESPVKRNLRLQIAVSALEMFYISPIERQYIWDALVIPRLAQVCQMSGSEVEAFAKLLKDSRNDVAHRGGLTNNSAENPKLEEATVEAERILRKTLCWGIHHQHLIDNAFEENEWPVIHE